MKPERITNAWAKGLKERLADAKPSLENAEPGPYDEQIDLACFYARKAQAYKDMTVEIGKDLKDYLKGHEADATTHEFDSAIESINAISYRYEEMSNTIWDSFEEEAIRANDDEAPFINLLGAVYAEIVDDYKRAVRDIRSPNWKKHMKGIKNYVECRDYFHDSVVERVVENEIDPLLRDYIRIIVKAFYGREY